MVDRASLFGTMFLKLVNALPHCKLMAQISNSLRNRPSARFLKNTLLAFLFILTFSSSALMAQPAPGQPAASDELEKFKSVPVWYLSYRVSLKADATTTTGTADKDHSTTTTSLERIDNGSLRLGIMSLGPSLSLTEQNEAAMMDRINDFMTWSPGLKPDELQSAEEQMAGLIKVNDEDSKVHESYRFATERVGVMVEGEGKNVSQPYEKTTRVTIGGSGTVVPDRDEFILEIDAANKKYKLQLEHLFTDSEDSMEAATYESRDYVGEDRENVVTHKQGLGNSGVDTILSVEPEMGSRDFFVIEGTLPDTVGNISGSPSYQVRVMTKEGGEVKGTLTLQYVLSPEPPEEEELIIEPPPDYEEWRPVAEQSEKITGDLVPIKLKLQKKGGGDPKFKVQRFIYNLRRTSQEKGVCMNWPAKPEADPPYDLQFEAQYNRDLVLADPKGQEAQQSVEGKTQGEVNISCFDYGAYGEFEAMAELENGVIVHGVVKGTQDEQLELPAHKDGSIIAKSFLKNLGDLKDDDDSEDDPKGDGFKGDGLALYEEYRGFMDGDHWAPGDPKKKDVFVLNQMRGMPQVLRGIKVFESATGLKVHKLLRDNQVDDGLMINFNRTDAPHVVDQHVIRIKAAKTLAEGGGARVDNVGTPGTAKAVNMPPDWEEFRQVGSRSIPSFERTIAHEMSHDCNIYHHGEADEDVWWVLTKNPIPQIVEVAPSGRMNIIVQRENGSEITADAFFPANTPEGNGYKMKIGVAHGQHSGAEECLMRYWVAQAYRSNSDPQIRYLSPGEIRGTILCSTTAGTGVNAPGHAPQSRYGTAATPANGGAGVIDNRGNCKKQLRVNDLGEEPKR